MSIKTAIIAPASHLRQYSALGDIEMALTHLIVPNIGFEHTKSVKENYVRYFRQRSDEGKWIILDNSAYEIGKLEAQSATGQGLGPELVLQAAELIKPSIVIAQDVLCDREATYEATKDFIRYADKKGLLGTVQIMAVAQGKTKDEWLSSFEELSELDNVDQVGLSKISVPLAFGDSQVEDGCVARARLQCTKDLVTYFSGEQLSFLHRIKVHLLGGDNWLPWELSQQKEHAFIYSNDSSAPVWYGGYGKKTFDPSSGKIDKIITSKPDLENVGFLTPDYMEKNKSKIYHNISVLHKFSK